jgi:hypothetical protein
MGAVCHPGDKYRVTSGRHPVIKTHNLSRTIIHIHSLTRNRTISDNYCVGNTTRVKICDGESSTLLPLVTETCEFACACVRVCACVHARASVCFSLSAMLPC